MAHLRPVILVQDAHGGLRIATAGEAPPSGGGYQHPWYGAGGRLLTLSQVPQGLPLRAGTIGIPSTYSNYLVSDTAIGGSGFGVLGSGSFITAIDGTAPLLNLSSIGIANTPSDATRVSGLATCSSVGNAIPQGTSIASGGLASTVSSGGPFRTPDTSSDSVSTVKVTKYMTACTTAKGEEASQPATSLQCIPGGVA
jgi:hypothetical protein